MSGIINKAKDALNLNDVKINGQKIHPTGYGLMGLTWRPEPQSQEKSIEAMRFALSQGANFWNGGEFYGTPERNSLQLLNAYFTKYPEDASKVVLSIKGGLKDMKPDGSAENTRNSIENCLRLLDGKKKLDIWEAARVDNKVPIEVTMRAANEYIKAGKLGGISLSECSADSIRRAAKVVKVSAVEVEFSLMETQILSNGVAKACADLDIPIVAYSPLGRGFLTGQIKSINDIPENDMRRHIPRFNEENFDKNLELVHEVEKIAQRKKCTPGQVGMAWVRAQSRRNGLPTIVPIPGATTAERIKENMTEVSLSEEDIKEIDKVLSSVTIVGGRYADYAAPYLFGDSPEEK